MAKLTPGTPRPGARTAYTQEQYDVLETLKDPKYTLGVAKRKYVNNILCPDGTLVTDDVEGMIAAVQARATELLASDVTDEAVWAEAQRVAAVLREVQDHVDQKRFLFIVDENMVPVIYFQCAVAHNEDVKHLRRPD